MSAVRMSESAWEDKVAERYSQEGYEVVHHPTHDLLPFDLGSYRPDLLVVKPDGERYLVEVKGSHKPIPVEKYQEVAKIVSKEPGWRFLLVTNSGPEDALAGERKPLEWDEIDSRVAHAERLRSLGEYEAGFLTLWTAFEAVLRKRALDEYSPLESLQVSSIINHLYSQGELSIEQSDTALGLLGIRNLIAHGFQSSTAEEAFARLETLVRELIEAWQPERNLTFSEKPTF